MTKVYFRNPYWYPGIVSDDDVRIVSFDKGGIHRRRIDPLAFMRMRFGDRPWEVMVTGIQGAAIYDQTSKNTSKPLAVFPAWAPVMDIEKLEDLCRSPVGENEGLCSSSDIAPEWRPVLGQPHRILIYTENAKLTESSVKEISRLAGAYPDVEFILHGSQSFPRMFLLAGVTEVTFDPHTVAAKNGYYLPTGTMVRMADGAKDPEGANTWIGSLGFRASDLETLTGRARLTFAAARWAAANMRNLETLYERVDAGDFDDTEPDTNPALSAWRISRAQMRTRRRFPLSGEKRPGKRPGDGILCDDCSLKTVCAYYREGLVCGLPSRETSKLAKQFGTRDANAIIEGLLKLGEIQATRLGADLEDEAKDNVRRDSTDRRIKMLTDHATKTAKLIDPKLNGGGVSVNVGVLGGAGGVGIQVGSTPQELISGMVRELESRGIPREEITNDAILGLLEATASRRGTEILEEVIEGEIIED